ncbi:uncharacterized protein SPPG_08429 [Spizellomyces punctatus DAOM BR117]|uniref:Uncharacterized protein n=1 Tax=Spizellomyces punctatus (strain DAOM BR117) TaxID=645134 RepID=A0A0L0H4Y9_SPIPD|nr:uncharacterized protein SPPG_08429 [Spizellomyces punctatus DAOM BR117]KNC96277.1 hypothetical protein SPPG_08429 [Spizellomyces punctatus DAOM BR117]|eukprot:XP_016604317.1 hypothetical protein SPPG_08429 [Spizellomyces punctatus DAOM BR117]
MDHSTPLSQQNRRLSQVSKDVPSPTKPRSHPVKTVLKEEQVNRLLDSFSFSYEDRIAKALEPDASESTAPSILETGYLESVDIALEKVKKQCKDALEQLEQVQKQLRSRSQRPHVFKSPIPGTTVSGEEAMRMNAAQRKAILQEKERALRAELEQRKRDMLVFENDDEIVLDARVRKEVVEIVDQYQSDEGLTALENQLWKELNRKESEQGIEQFLEQKRDDLRNCVEDTVKAKGANVAILQKQKEVKERLQEECNEFEKTLRAFVQRHYPLPAIMGSERKRPLERDDGAELAPETCHSVTQLSLMNIIDQLLQQFETTPDDPYITLLNGTYYPPHVEMLLRADVVERDEQNPARIKLVDFHL